MSFTDTLGGYENNNEINNITQQLQQQQQQQNKHLQHNQHHQHYQQQQQQQQHQHLQQQLLKQRRSSSLYHNNSIQSSQSTTASSVSSSSYSMGKNCTPSVNSNFSNSAIIGGISGPPLHTPPQQHKYMNSKRKHTSKYSSMAGGHHPHAALSASSSHYDDHNNYLHLNSLWSIWYGVLLTLFQGYLAVHGAYRFLGCSLIPWKIEPVAELNLQIVLSGVVFILLPLFFTSAVFKVGNLANDGIKLATGAKALQRCSITPADGLEEEASGGTLRALWTHGGPTAAFVHILIAMCLLLPRLLLEARIIENGLLPKENIWQTELDFMAVNRRNLVVLSVITAPYQNMTSIEDTGNEEDYFNDTMYTAVNNNLLELNTDLNTERTLRLHKNQLGDGEGGYDDDNDNFNTGKIRFFEVPDLINRVAEENNNNEHDRIGNYGNGWKSVKDKGTVDNGEERFPARGGDGVGKGDDMNANSDEYNAGNRIGLKNGNEHSIVSGGAVQFMEFPITTTPTTASSPTTQATSRNSLLAKSYDKSWDKLGTLSKDNSLSGPSKTTAATINDKSSTSSPSSTTTTAPISISTSAATSTSTMQITTTTTLASTLATTKLATIPLATTGIVQNTFDSTSTTVQSSSLSNTMSPTISAATGAFPTQSASQSTRTHSTQHHHNQHNQHHRQQHQHSHHQHQHQHGNKSSTRKHGSRHRQRGQNSRRHHATTSTTTTTRTSSTSVSDVNFNRFDELNKSKVDKSKSYGNDFSGIPLYPYAYEDESNDYGRARAYIPKSTLAIKPTTMTTTRDSNIHIVKPEMLPPEIIPSTPLTSNSKIIEIKTKSSKKVKRMADDAELQVEIEPEYLIGDLTGGSIGQVSSSRSEPENDKSQNDSNEYMMTSSSSSSSSPSSSSLGISSENSDERDDYVTTPSSNLPTATATAPMQPIVHLDGFAGMLQIFFGIDKPIDISTFAHPPSAEFVNLLFALLVWCVRYPAVFWTTTKSFATIFSIQMIVAAMDIVFGYIGTANLYKFQVYSEAMPIQNPGLILNGIVTLALYLLSTVLVLASSMIMYLYGHGRLAAKMRDRSLITLKASETWIYFAHCASLCFVLALAVVKAPLLNDLSATYKNNLHCPTFLSALISVVYLLLWIVIWLGLTAKRRWTFKLPPVDTYGLTKATTQPLLMAPNRGGSIPSTGSSISGSGSTAHTSSDQKGVISNTTTTSTDGGGCVIGSVGGIGGNTNGTGSIGQNCNGDDDIYWPKLAPNSPKLKVTFNEVTSTSDDDVLLIDDGEQQQQQHEHSLNDGNKRNTSRGAQVCFAGTSGEIDDGEYATLRAASAATIVGIGTNVNSSGGNGPIGVGGHHRGGLNNATSPNNGTLNTVGSAKILHLNEYDELPPPPPPTQMLPMTQTHHHNTNTNTIISSNNNNSLLVGGSITTTTTTITGIVGDYANCGAGIYDDNISEEGKLLECVRDDSVTYASTRELDPPQPPPPPPPLDAHQINNNSNTNSTTNSTNYNNNNNQGCRLVTMNAGRAPQAMPESMQLSSSPEHLVSPLAPVTVTVHTNEAHIHSSSTPRVLRRADSGVPNEALTPRSDTTTESTISPPERAPSESSSGVHSGEERDVEVVIRSRAGCKPPAKLPQPAIQEEPYGRCTNMRMSSFVSEPIAAAAAAASSPLRMSSIGAPSSSATLPLTRSTPEPKFDYTHCSTMPLPIGCHSQLNSSNSYSSSSAQSMTQPQQQPQPQNVSTFKSMYANSAIAMSGANAAAAAQFQQQQLQQQQQKYDLQQLQQQLQQQLHHQGLHTTLPNGVRYSNPQHFLRRMPHVSKAAESPYGHLGLGAGHHTFSKLLHDPLQGAGNCLANTTIPEDRDSANYSMSSDYDTNLYATANHMH